MKTKILQLMLLALMLISLVSFGSLEMKLDNLGDLSVDVAFQLALPYFFEQHLQFGEQVVFTYGPWGVLVSAFAGPYIQIIVLLFHVVLCVSVFLAFCVLAERNRSSAVTWGGSIAIVALWITGQRESYFLFPALLVAYQHLAVSITSGENKALEVRRWVFLLWVVLSMLAGWLALAKYNIFIVASVSHLLILADNVWRRHWPVLPFAYVVALVSAWLAGGQNITNLPLWVSRCWDLSSGYSDAMSKGFFTPYDASLVVVYYGSVVLITLAAFAAAAWHRWSFSALLSLLFTLFLCAISVKHGMGGNQIEQSLAVLFCVLWFVSQLFFISSPQRAELGICSWRSFSAGSVLAAIMCLVVVAARTNFPISNTKQFFAALSSKVSLLIHSPRDILNDRWSAALEKTHRFWQSEILLTGQTIDVYPQHNGVVIGRESLHYSPRPAFLSLNAHTYALAKLNALHLDKTAAPDLILFQIIPRASAVNNRHPALADGPSWPELLTRYAPERIGNEFLLLKKRPLPLHFSKRLLLKKTIQMGESLSLPQSDGSLIWAELEIRRNPVGRVIHLLYKSPHVLLESDMMDNVRHKFQIVPELGQAGFLMSPLVRDNFAFANLYKNEGVLGDKVKSIKISSPEAPEFFWEKEIRLKLWAFNVDDGS